MNWRRIGKYALLIGIVISLISLIVISWIKFSTFLFLYVIYLWISNGLVSSTGMNRWLAHSITAIGTIPLVYLISLIFSLDKTKRNIGLVGFFIFLSFCNLGMFLYTVNEVNFNPSGKAVMFFCSFSGEEHKVDYQGYCRKHGVKLEPLTPEIVKKYFQQTSKADSKENGMKILGWEPDELLKLIGYILITISCLALTVYFYHTLT